MTLTKEYIYELLAEVKDPEVPVLSIEELGVLREVEIVDGLINVIITPTYSGCPAMNAIEDEIRNTMAASGIKNIKIETTFSPPWTTDWMTQTAKNKLKEYGIAPPGKTDNDSFLKSFLEKQIVCPFCDSGKTIVKSEFGSTACKSLHYCNSCRQPFEHFKCI
ncbi:MAG: phenylacetate-CoA oxygenase subunit PaaJ [Melioribacteraceae bacterium]|nr:phenylacetate-CoA oxygenase subunit PaaJ [Melioribacteraceae bacterium]MCF8263739.1 phenylacetate-CoA oxygenase subunit PaaJ [Melioribacteraceae bacterium]MCF8412681.1 phenylacetate-CoA oxygenase subunit PaaJ [Melioribacteraceae bacterium]MCF8430973.1 phenylacetate-CoA oxygenase subunit PaaJ [Melioribacteraceae bacterium]